MENIKIKNVDDNKAVVNLTGRLDVAISGQIEETLLDVIEKQSIKYMVLNMEDVEYMSSSGFRVAIALLRKLRDNEGVLKICSLKPAVKRIFDVIELTSLFEIYDNEEEALASLQ
ncbi:MAG: STAS domain-containing protein [Spirochaetia bacterium]|nr:STAS domain-containing protein [Spirochaetia bacterium]